MVRLFKYFVAVLMFAPGLLLADGAVSRVVPGINDKGATTENKNSKDTVARTTVSRTVGARDTNSETDSAKSGAVGRVSGAVRGTVSRVFAGDADNVKTATGAVRARTASRSVSAAQSASSSARSNLEAAVNTVGRNSRVQDASINSNPAVRRAGLVLRPSTAEVGGRATLGDSGVQTGSNIDEVVRGIKTRAAKNMTAESIAEATQKLEQTASLNKSCQQQYNECMDQFCAVIDANQGRCSCSANLSKYTKVEEAVKDANTQLNEVAQRIRYVGLSADEIRAIMSETEAEEALSGATDTSETRNMLEEIENLIRDPSAGSTYSGDNFAGLDLDLDFSSDTADIFSLDFLNTDTTASFSNLRGTDLYNAAKRRCTTVLNQCKDAGATLNQITGNYDLAIDKDCIAYEQGLNKMNETLVSNVRSANRMLQKARLAVLQNKNQYDAKGCIAALETCMKDDMVCGDDYFKCVDPTKKYIDENGEVVLGQNISNITAFMEDYNNARIGREFLKNAYNSQNISDTDCAAEVKDNKYGGNDGSCVAKYLMTKIGTKQRVTDEGLCRAVLDKCQYYTYDSNGNYKSENDVVINYVQRAMVSIRAAQHRVIADYASSCMLDIATCYNQQVTQVNSWASNASVSSVYNVMRGACRNVALTCAYAVFDNSDVELCYTDASGEQSCSVVNDKEAKMTPEQYIEGISEIFYQSLLCPDNSSYQPGGIAAANVKLAADYEACEACNNESAPEAIAKCDANYNKTEKTGEDGKPVYEYNCEIYKGSYGVGNGGLWVNERCMCNYGYQVWGSSCVVMCPVNALRNSYGTCVCSTGYTMKDGTCVADKVEDNTGEEEQPEQGGDNTGEEGGGDNTGEEGSETQ